MDEYAGRVAVVTGAASGLGRGYADRFASEGMKVVLADIDEAALDGAVAELRAGGHDVLGVRTDVTDPESVDALAGAAFERYGKVHVLCNNAGGGGGVSGPIWEIPLEQWRRSLALNTYGVVHGIRSFVPRMIEMDEEAHVVNTASMSGLVAGGGVYGAAKHAVVSISETLHLQLQRRGLKVRAHCLCPWWMRTGILRGRPDASTREAIESGMLPADVVERVMQAFRDGRFYILPQHELDGVVLGRASSIVEERAPESMTPAEAAARFGASKT